MKGAFLNSELNSGPGTEQPMLPYLIVGLGNPGRQYRETRHNVGFATLDRLATRLKLAYSRVQFRALVIDGRHNQHRLFLAKPQTYMNESGQAVGALMKFYKIPLENLLVVHDDVDLPLGTLRIRPGGGSAGQKGVGSIIDRVGTQDFPRLRIGVGRPPGQMLAAAYVLQEFSRGETELVAQTLERAVDAALAFVTDGLDKTMNQYNGQLTTE
jgi:PTH1 family peptidyl-tRNA hydrolase